MKLSHQARIICLSVLLLSVFLGGHLKADTKQWITINETLPETAKTFNVKLTFQQDRARFFDKYDSDLQPTPVDSKKKDAYQQQFDLGTLFDGNQYIVQVKEPSGVSVIGDSYDRMCMVNVMRSEDGKKFETVKEGLLTFNRDLDIPLEISPEAAGVPFDKPLSGNLEIDIYSNGRDTDYRCRARTTLNGTLSGSVATQEAMLRVSLTPSALPVDKNCTLQLSALPHDNTLSGAEQRGKLTDTLKLGSANVIVEKIAADSSEIVLAQLSGEFVIPKQKIESAVEIDKPFPPFARVDLIRRELITLNDLKEEAGPDGYIVLVFGDFRVPMPAHYGGPQMGGLSLEAEMIEKMLNKDCDTPAVLVFICRQLSLADLYEKWLGDAPGYRVLADYSNPMMTRFLGSRIEPHMMMQRGPERGETLRGQLHFEPNKIITTLVDGSGKLLYLNTNAGNELSASLMQINKLVCEKNREQSPQE